MNTHIADFAFLKTIFAQAWVKREHNLTMDVYLVKIHNSHLEELIDLNIPTLHKTLKFWTTAKDLSFDPLTILILTNYFDNINGVRER